MNLNSQALTVTSQEAFIEPVLDKHETDSMNKISEVINVLSCEKEESFIKQR